MTKPAIVLVHGAWHRPHHYTRIVEPLREMGYAVATPVLPTSDSTQSVFEHTLQDDVKAIRAALHPFLEAGQEIIVVLHSYGGIPGTDSVVGETVEERSARGDPGGVQMVVYMAAFVPPSPKTSLFDLIGMKDESAHPHWWTPKDGFIFLNESAKDALYQDVASNVAGNALASTVKQSISSFKKRGIHSAAEIKAPKIYVACKQDAAVPYQGQVSMAEAAGADIITLECGHSPFLKPVESAELVKIITRITVSN